jgi:hypothetical protein
MAGAEHDKRMAAILDLQRAMLHGFTNVDRRLDGIDGRR